MTARYSGEIPLAQVQSAFSALNGNKIVVLENEALHPALKVLGLPQAGMHAFRHGCNRRWELAGMNPAVLRQKMGHTENLENEAVAVSR
jgi:hypothetical protein